LLNRWYTLQTVIKHIGHTRESERVCAGYLTQTRNWRTAGCLPINTKQQTQNHNMHTETGKPSGKSKIGVKAK